DCPHGPHHRRLPSVVTVLRGFVRPSATTVLAGCDRGGSDVFRVGERSVANVSRVVIPRSWASRRRVLTVPERARIRRVGETNDEYEAWTRPWRIAGGVLLTGWVVAVVG